MRLFLDTSVVLAASGSAKCASRYILNEAKTHDWELISSDYRAEEPRRNLRKLSRASASAWKNHIMPLVRFAPGKPVLDKPLIFPKTKDRPVVITALAVRAAWLLTLDEGDFHTKQGRDLRFAYCCTRRVFA